MTKDMERRTHCLRRDLNDLVRDEAGRFSFEKVGTYLGQYIAAQYLLVHWEQSIKSWDIMTVLFSVLIAPSLFKKLMNMKYGGTDDKTLTTEITEPVAAPVPMKTTKTVLEPAVAAKVITGKGKK